MVTKECRGIAERDDFGVRSRVGIGDVSIVSAPDDFAVENDDRADWNLSNFKRALGRAQCFVHPQFV